MSFSPTLKLIYDDISRIAAALGPDAHYLAGKRLLLTGASSHIASYLAYTITWLNDYVLASPCSLIALVRSPVVAGTRLAALRGRPDVTFIEQDVSAPLCLDGPVDLIVHAASRASPKSYLADPLDTIAANVFGTRQLLELARTQPVSSFLFFSSSEIYGDAGRAGPIAESDPGQVDSLDPRACYVESKRFAETLCAAYWRACRVPVKIVRPFHVYGPGLRLDDGRVMADLFLNRVKNEPIQLLSDGTGIRSFCYISDATVGFCKALFSDYNGEVFNIGDDRAPISIRELAATVAALREPRLPVRCQDEAPAHLRSSPQIVHPDLTRARNLLDYAPCVNLRGGLARTLEWLDHQVLEHPELVG